MRRLDLSGQRFGRLVAIEIGRRGPTGNIEWRCRCDCGGEKLVFTGALKGGFTRSCGCLQMEMSKALNRRHGQYKSAAYSSWAGMIQRCTNPNDDAYRHYGGRGIAVCDRWRDFQSFLADMGQPPLGMSIERIDNDGPYSPENCRWATQAEQMNNTRLVTRLTCNGVTKTLHEWAREKAINPRTLQKRLNSGWSPDRAITAPVMSQYARVR